MAKKWSLRNIILIALIAIVCGVIFWLTSFIYNALTLILTPIGLAPAANDLSLGLWIVAGPLAGAIFKMPGVSIFSEVAGAVVEMFLGDQWGVMNVVSGLIQGAGAELGFAVTGYKKYGHFQLFLGAVFTTVITFTWDWFKNGYNAYHVGFIILLFILRFISVWVFSDPIPTAINKLLNRSHAIEA
ncbi:ECF transporter S component [Nicoliella lavandulae]|uniref:ECF transporter S component n=1 Tax=Nicoliella lavandulae TaxID=3082954 RepID=A0ABU8SKI5_9LACO